MMVSSELRDAKAPLQVYLLGTMDFEDALTLQRRLVYEISGDRDRAALILCQHPPVVTVGRQGSYNHILCDADECRSRRWSIRWVNRGGGCLLHMPGQLAIYPILPLNPEGAGLPAFVASLQMVLLNLLGDFSIPGQTRADHAGIWVNSRQIAAIGIAVRDWVTYYGAAINVNPALEPFRLIRCGGRHEPPMTSVERERRGPISPSLFRQRLIEHFTSHFNFHQFTVFTNHPVIDGVTNRAVSLYDTSGR